MATDESLLTQDDIALLNRAAVERGAWVARIAGSVVIAVGGITFLMWAWSTVRTQQQVGDGAQAVDVIDRVDLLLNAIIVLAIAALLVGLGFLIRLAADYCQTRVGGSISGFAVGDVVPPDDDEPDDGAPDDAAPVVEPVPSTDEP